LSCAFTSPCHVAFLAILPVDLGALLILFHLEEFCLQHRHRELAVAALASLRLARDDDATRLVHDPDGGLDLVHVLPAFAPGAISVDLEFGFIDLDRRGLRQLRHDIDRGKGGVPALI
jgi:hypothetical protein